MSTHNLRPYLSAWLPVLLWMGGIFVFSAQSSLPGLPDDVADTILKKSGHAAEYAVLAILAVRAFRAGRPLARRDLWRALLLAALYAATDEFHQSFVPGRNARLFDWGLDTVGAALGLLAAHLAASPRRRVLPSRRLLAVFFLVASAVLWGGSFIAARIVLREVSPVTLATVRFSLAALFFLGLLAVAPRYRAAWRDLPKLAFYGLLAITFYFILQYNGVERTSASLSAIVITLAPLVVVILSTIFLHERLTWPQVAGIVLATVGAGLLVTRGSLEIGGVDYWWGVFFLVLNVLAWGLYNILGKRTLTSQHPMTLTAYMTILGAVGLLPFAAWDGGLARIGDLSGLGWLAIGYLVIFCTIVAYFGYNYALRIVPASEAGVYLYLNPVAAVIFAYLLLAEPVTWITFVGGGMAIGGVYLANRS